MTGKRALHAVGTVELISLVLMLANLVTVHLPVLSSTLGGLHGLAYTATVISAVLFMGGQHRVWLLALIPGIGGLVAARTLTPIDSPPRN